MERIKFKKLSDNAILPTRAHSTDAGLDLYATSVSFNDKFVEYGLGLAMEIDPGYVGLICPRSSITNYDLMLKNSIGCIDAFYRGEVKARFLRTGNRSSLQYNVGDKIAQLLIVPVKLAAPEWADELSDTERGTGGWGSTGV